MNETERKEYTTEIASFSSEELKNEIIKIDADITRNAIDTSYDNPDASEKMRDMYLEKKEIAQLVLDRVTNPSLFNFVYNFFGVKVGGSKKRKTKKTKKSRKYKR